MSNSGEPRMFKIVRELKTYKKEARKLAKRKSIPQRKANYQILDDIFDDLPDGAYFAAMEEYGFDAEDIIELSDE